MKVIYMDYGFKPSGNSTHSISGLYLNSNFRYKIKMMLNYRKYE